MVNQQGLLLQKRCVILHGRIVMPDMGTKMHPLGCLQRSVILVDTAQGSATKGFTLHHCTLNTINPLHGCQPHIIIHKAITTNKDYHNTKGYINLQSVILGIPFQ